MDYKLYYTEFFILLEYFVKGYVISPKTLWFILLLIIVTKCYLSSEMLLCCL